MKAKEYYAKYHNALNTAAPGAIETQMLYDFRQELEAMKKQRRTISITAQNGITRELNDKWNAVAALFKAKDGKSPIAQDAFLNWRTKGTEKAKKEVQRTGTRLYPVRSFYHPSRPVNFANPNAMVTMAMLGQMVCSG